MLIIMVITSDDVINLLAYIYIYNVTDTKVNKTVDNHYNVSNLSEVTKFFKHEFNFESFLIVLSRAEVAR